MEYEYKTENGISMRRPVYTYLDPGRWEMISACEGPHESKKTYKTSWDANPDYIVCPYCGHEHDPEGSDYNEPDERQCYDCEKYFHCEPSFGHGFIVTPSQCQRNTHEFVFDRQYEYEQRTWRVSKCIHCDASDRQVTKEGKPARTLLPWLEEYNDPDYFDPERVLKPTEHVDLGERSKTPYLDALEKYRKKREWLVRVKASPTEFGWVGQDFLKEFQYITRRQS